MALYLCVFPPYRIPLARRSADVNVMSGFPYEQIERRHSCWHNRTLWIIRFDDNGIPSETTPNPPHTAGHPFARRRWRELRAPLAFVIPLLIGWVFCVLCVVCSVSVCRRFAGKTTDHKLRVATQSLPDLRWRNRHRMRPLNDDGDDDENDDDTLDKCRRRRRRRLRWLSLVPHWEYPRTYECRLAQNIRR